MSLQDQRDARARGEVRDWLSDGLTQEQIFARINDTASMEALRDYAAHLVTAARSLNAYDFTIKRPAG